ncbi:hypothetical protein B296_00007235 [Ensete ventricosum]|uniref:Uncharacterized protein n=1 Tax=Ensete ventricosum TaxID=4639 RepID=A0A427AXB9_ENSVE|nr:hypothetical protein B296_00007235 [Ensete ventricosum]
MAPHSASAHLGWAVRGAGDSEKTKEEASETLEVSLASGAGPVAEGSFVKSFQGDDQLSRSPSRGESPESLNNLYQKEARKPKRGPSGPSVSHGYSRLDAHLEMQLLGGSREFLHEGLVELGKARCDPSNDQVIVYVLFV